MATKRFYSSKFYPVNYDTKTIYNDPQRRAGDCDLNSVTYRDKGTVGIRGFRLNNFEQTYSTFTLVDVADKAIYREADAKRAVDNYEREFADDSRRGTTAALSGRHSSPVGIDDPEDDRVYDLIFSTDFLGDVTVSDPLPPDVPDDVFIDRLITVTDRDTLAFTDGLSSDGTAVVAHLYDVTSQQWACAVIPLDFVGFLPGVTLEQENAWVASLRSMATVGEVV